MKTKTTKEQNINWNNLSDKEKQNVYNLYDCCYEAYSLVKRLIRDYGEENLENFNGIE